MTPSEQDIRDVAKRAAEVLRERGWTRGSFVNADGCVCMVGALNVAEGLPPDAEGVCIVRPGITSRIVRLTGDQSIPRWNDHESRTAAEVIAVLERVAAGEGVA